jgi:hypothetical protein
MDKVKLYVNNHKDNVVTLMVYCMVVTILSALAYIANQ